MPLDANETRAMLDLARQILELNQRVASLTDRIDRLERQIDRSDQAPPRSEMPIADRGPERPQTFDAPHRSRPIWPFRR